MSREFSDNEILELAKLAAADYAAACTGPTIRGLNGEKNLRGSSIEEVADNNGITVEEAKELTIDLSAASFDEMSDHWKQVNIDSARGMIALLPSFSESGDADEGAMILMTMLKVPNFNVQRKYASILHDAWLKLPANSWALGGDLDVPFEELPEEEQAKDVQQLMSLYTWLTNHVKWPDVYDGLVNS